MQWRARTATSLGGLVSAYSGEGAEERARASAARLSETFGTRVEVQFRATGRGMWATITEEGRQ